MECWIQLLLGAIFAKIFAAPMEYSDGGFHEGAPRHEYTGVKTLRALTIKQVVGLQADSASSIYIIDGAEISNIQICGYITSTRNSSAGTIFEVDDTTAAMDCAFWPNGAYDDVIAERICEKSLVKATGTVKIFNNKKTLNISALVTVATDFLVYHLTSALYQSLFFQNRIERPQRRETKGGSGMSAIQSDILQTYRNNQDDNGLEIDLVVNMLQDKYPVGEIRSAIEGLLTDCHLYSVDGSSYKTTI